MPVFYSNPNKSISAGKILGFAHKAATLLFLLFFMRIVTPALASESAEYFDNIGFEERYAKEMGRLMEEGKTRPVSELVEQLKAEKGYAFTPTPRKIDEALRAAQLYRRLSGAVVGLGNVYLCDRCDKLHPSLAGGVIIGEDGHILTNYHVLDVSSKAQALGVILRDGRVFPIDEVLASDKANDLALVKIDAEGLTAATVAEDVPVGADVFVISHPDRHYYIFTSGVVSGKNLGRTREGVVEQISITADYARGSSGAPAFNSRGEIVGLVRSTDTVLYDRKHKSQVQMVWKYLVPFTSIKDLLGE